MSKILTAGGMPIVHLQDAEVDERFVAMTENPFLHGCCDCGLFHKVEYKIVDAEGCELQIPAGAMLALRFSRDEDQTEHFRESRRAGEGIPVWKDLHDTAQDLILDASVAGVAAPTAQERLHHPYIPERAGALPADVMRLQAINRYGVDPLFRGRIRDLTARVLSAVMKHQAEIEVIRRNRDANVPMIMDNRGEIEELQAQIANYEEACSSCKKLVRELDVLLNGEEGAAEQASICDLVAQLRRERRSASGVVIDRKFRISAVNPVNGKKYDETNSLLLCVKDAAVPAALAAYAEECERIGANPEHSRRGDLDVAKTMRKLGEEVGEFIEAVINGEPGPIAEEAVDVLFVMCHIVRECSGGAGALNEAAVAKLGVIYERLQAKESGGDS